MEEEPIAKNLTTNFFNKYIHYTIVPRGPPRLRTGGLDRSNFYISDATIVHLHISLF